MKHLIIIGARGYGREIVNAVPDCRGYGTKFVLKGFLDSNADALEGFKGYPPILGAPEDYTPEADDVFFCAMGDVKRRKHYVEMLLAKGAKFQTLVEKTALLGKNVIIGDGCYIGERASLTVDIKVENFSSVFRTALLGHDVKVGQFCHIGGLTHLGGGVCVEDCVTVHPGVMIVPHCKIRMGATIGVGSVVIRNVRAGKTVFGNPAVPLEDFV